MPNKLSSLRLRAMGFEPRCCKVLTYKVNSTIISPGSWVSVLAGNSHARKLNKAQKNRANITGIHYFRGLWSYLRAHQQEWCQLRLIVYLLFLLPPQKLHQLHIFSSTMHNHHSSHRRNSCCRQIGTCRKLNAIIY